MSYRESDKIKFCDYAEQWVENIMLYNNEGYNYYSRCKSNLKIFKEKLTEFKILSEAVKILNKVKIKTPIIITLTILRIISPTIK